MKVTVEIGDKTYRLVMKSSTNVPCRLCAMRKRCLGRYCETKKRIYRLCRVTDGGFREVKQKKGAGQNA